MALFTATATKGFDMKKLFMAGALALGCYTGAAQAAPTITSPTTLNLINLGTSTTSGFQALPTLTAVANGIVSVSATGGAPTGVYSGSSPGATTGFSSPFGTGSNQNYLAIEPGGSITIAFTAAQTSFGLLFGTIDSYNSITFGIGPSAQTFTGSMIASALGLSATGSATANVLFSGLNQFSTVTLTDSTSSAFEFVPAASSVPEPAAWGMMILGFGLAGSVLRRRPTVKVRYA